MGFEEFIYARFYSSKGEEIARIRVKFETYKNTLLWSTTQLEGFILGKWLPLIRYDFDPEDKFPVHINREYISTNDLKNKTEFKCHPKLLIFTATKLLSRLTDTQILDFIDKRTKVFIRKKK